MFNSTCDKNPSCRTICERDKHAQKCLQDLRFTKKNCIVVKLKTHYTESCCQKADTSTMLGILLPTGDISGEGCFIKKKKVFQEPSVKTKALGRLNEALPG